MLVYPAPGLRVRDPETRRLVSEDGIEVSETDLIWARLLRDGDVVIEKPASPEPAHEPEPAQAAEGEQAPAQAEAEHKEPGQ